MRLLSAHIMNFGKLSDVRLNFNDNIVSFCEENGYGKTTIAAFLSAMLYGLDKHSVKTFSDRDHYSPFQGGTFGGSLELEAGGKVLTIRRTFDKKSPVRDTAEVFDERGNKLDWNKEEIGPNILGIDVNSFRKTVFLSSTNLSFENTESISRKLNGLVNTGAESYDKILSAIDETLKKIKRTDRRGNTLSKVQEIDNEIFSCEQEIDRLNHLGNSLDEKYKSYDAANKQLQILQKKKNSIAEQKVIKERWLQYCAKCDERTALQERLLGVQAGYPGGLPTRTELDWLSQQKDQYQLACTALEQEAFTNEDDANLFVLQEQYPDGILPGEAEIEAARECIVQIETNRTKLAMPLTPPANLRDLEAAFYTGMPSEEDLCETRALMSEYQATEAKKQSLVDSMLTATPQKTNQALPLVSLFLGLAVVAISLLLFGSVSAGIATPVMVSGIGLLLIGLVLFTRSSRLASTGSADHIRTAIAEADASLAALSNRLTAFFVQYRISGHDHASNFALLQLRMDEYASWHSKQAEYERSRAELTARNEALLANVKAFFEPYGVSTEDLSACVPTLRDKMAAYRRLIDKANRYRKRLTQREALKNAIRDALAGYGIAMEEDIANQLRTLSEADRELTHLRRAIVEKENEIREYKEANEIPDEAPAYENADVDVDELDEQITDYITQIQRLDSDIRRIEQDLESRQDYLAKIHQLNEQKAFYETKYKNLLTTKEMFIAAQNSLHEKYIGPMETSFNAYAEKINRFVKEDATINFSFDVRYENGTKEHLSEGLRACLALCMRLAVIDNMYPDEKPFLILDDPFVNLDATNIESAVKVLRELSNEIQIIYFSCHESRAI